MEKAIEWIKNHKPHTAAIAIVVVAVIAVSIAAASGAFTQQDKTATDEQKTVDVTLSVTADHGWDENSTPAIAHIEGNDVDFYHAVTPDADGNVAKNPNASDKTKQEATDADKDVDVNKEPAQTTPPATTDNSNTGSQSSNTGSSNSGSTSTGNSGNSGSSSSQPSKPSKPAHTHTWVNHTATRQVWVSNWVDVPDYGTQKVVVGNTYTFSDGYSTTSIDSAKAHAKELILAGKDSGYQTTPVYEEQTVQTGSHKEDHGSYTTETYVDYVYCSSCGARQ